MTTIDRIKASKRKCKHQRDNWKARALVYRGALEEIAERFKYSQEDFRVIAQRALDDVARIGKGAGG